MRVSEPSMEALDHTALMFDTEAVNWNGGDLHWTGMRFHHQAGLTD